MFLRVDAEAPSHPKMRAAGKDGRALWHAVGPVCGGLMTDGVVPPIVVKDAGYYAEIDDVDAAAAALVKAGLWHDPKTIRRCERCTGALADVDGLGGKLPAGHFFFHDWREKNPLKAGRATDEARRKDNRKRQLHRNKALVDAVRERDGTLCRYCGKRVDFDDHRSDDGGTYDHVDPDGGNTLANVVVACRGCNIRKGKRTPDEAGMPLLAPLTARPNLGVVPTGSDPVSNPVGNVSDPRPETDSTRIGNGSGPDPTSRASRARLGTGSERVGSGLEPGLENGSERPGPEGAGAGPATGSGTGPLSTETNKEESA